MFHWDLKRREEEDSKWTRRQGGRREGGGGRPSIYSNQSEREIKRERGSENWTQFDFSQFSLDWAEGTNLLLLRDFGRIYFKRKWQTKTEKLKQVRFLNFFSYFIHLYRRKFELWASSVFWKVHTSDLSLIFYVLLTPADCSVLQTRLCYVCGLGVKCEFTEPSLIWGGPNK